MDSARIADPFEGVHKIAVTVGDQKSIISEEKEKDLFSSKTRLKGN